MDETMDEWLARETPLIEALELGKDRIYHTPCSRVFAQVVRRDDEWSIFIPGKYIGGYAEEPPKLLERVFPACPASGYYDQVDSRSPRRILNRVASFFRKGFPRVSLLDLLTRSTPPHSEWPVTWPAPTVRDDCY